jgi:putrescine transport system ATP-binding protein
VADFIGEVSLIEGRLSSPGVMDSALGPLRVTGEGRAGDKVWLGLRPEKIALSPQRPVEAASNALAGTVSEVGYRGDKSIYKVRLADRSLMKVALANQRGTPPFAPGDLVWLSWPADAGVVLTS